MYYCVMRKARQSFAFLPRITRFARETRHVLIASDSESQYSERNAIMVAENGKTRTVITFGTYDLFHYGHLRIIERAAKQGDRLIVGVSSDALNYKKKQVYPAVKEEQRMAIIASMKAVSEVFLEESLDLKKEYCMK